MTDRIKITKEMLEKFISDSSQELPLEEIEALMDSEVEKPEDEMDTELVDMCAAILAKAYNPGYKEEKPEEMYHPWEDEKKPETPKKKTVRFRYVLIAAAILVIVFTVALPAGARLFDNKASDGIIQFYDDFFKINLNKDEPTTAASKDAVSEMIINNLDSFMLPEVLRSDEYVKKAYLTQDGYTTVFYVNISNSVQNISGTIMITQYNNPNHDMTNGRVNVPDNTYRYFEQLVINDREVIVFGNDDKSYINYTDGSTNYEIALICDFNTMVSIAETINVKG